MPTFIPYLAFAAVAAVVGSIACENKPMPNDWDPHEQEKVPALPPPQKAMNEEAKRSYYLPYYQDLVRTLKNAAPGTKIDVLHDCQTGGSIDLEGKQNCRKDIFLFEKTVIENFSEGYLVACGAGFDARMGEMYASTLFFSASCSITKPNEGMASPPKSEPSPPPEFQKGNPVDL